MVVKLQPGTRYCITGGNKSTALGAGGRASGEAGSTGSRGLFGPGGIPGYDPLLVEGNPSSFALPRRPHEEPQLQQSLSQARLCPHPTSGSGSCAGPVSPADCSAVLASWSEKSISSLRCTVRPHQRDTTH